MGRDCATLGAWVACKSYQGMPVHAGAVRTPAPILREEGMVRPGRSWGARMARRSPSTRAAQSGRRGSEDTELPAVHANVSPYPPNLAPPRPPPAAAVGRPRPPRALASTTRAGPSTTHPSLSFRRLVFPHTNHPGAHLSPNLPHHRRNHSILPAFFLSSDVVVVVHDDLPITRPYSQCPPRQHSPNISGVSNQVPRQVAHRSGARVRLPPRPSRGDGKGFLL